MRWSRWGERTVPCVRIAGTGCGGVVGEKTRQYSRNSVDDYLTTTLLRCCRTICCSKKTPAIRRTSQKKSTDDADVEIETRTWRREHPLHLPQRVGVVIERTQEGHAMHSRVVLPDELELLASPPLKRVEIISVRGPPRSEIIPIAPQALALCGTILCSTCVFR